jgi:hypothetical protein
MVLIHQFSGIKTFLLIVVWSKSWNNKLKFDGYDHFKPISALKGQPQRNFYIIFGSPILNWYFLYDRLKFLNCSVSLVPVLPKPAGAVMKGFPKAVTANSHRGRQFSWIFFHICPCDYN